MDSNFSLDSLLNVSAVPQDDRVAAFIAESKNNRSRCYEMSEQMTAAVATDGQSFQQYLDVQSRFDRYTANNALLIMAQKPEAQKIGDYGYWRDQGAYVKRQERNNPILIMEPGKEYEREDGSTGTYYNAKKVYDISQTTAGGKIQQAQAETTDAQLVRAVVNNPPVAIVAAEPDQMPEDKGALFEPEEGCIYVRKGMSAQEIFRSVTPELALPGLRTGTRITTATRTPSMPIVRPTCSAKSMVWTRRGLTSPMRRNFSRAWSRRKSVGSYPKSVTQRAIYLPAWRKCWSRAGTRARGSSRRRSITGRKQDEGSKGRI